MEMVGGGEGNGERGIERKWEGGKGERGLEKRIEGGW